MSDLLDQEELKSALKKRPEWDLEGKSITRVVEFEDYMEGIDFVNLVAEVAEEAQHHPDITINYTKVTISLTSHEAGGITEDDIELADRISNLVD
ncbi:4a-hydroxytetrahydrobiopterin dehydratase [Haloferula chungangensis]|uniref:Putative pterin-4-alpha-carbinolamine dehydratase n=1 Tax=Haloferula chungangensis TaxID=1048331 RepID=A0ABW2LBF4_9BACT